MERGGRVDSFHLLHLAMKALWKRIGPTLGSVTLSAIVSRVHYTAAAKYAALDEISVSETGVSPGAAPRSNALDDQAREGVRFFLVELLTVMGSLTAEILTPAIHATLGEMTRAAIEPASEQRGPAR